MVQANSKKDIFYLDNLQDIISFSDLGTERHTILIVDDETNNLDLLKRTLRKEYTILTASNGEEALRVVEERGEEISLIISDQRMPAMEGTKFLEKVVEKYPHIIKMLLTGHTDLDTLVDSVNKCELFQYILKPFEPDELKTIVKNGIDVYELSDKNQKIVKALKELFFTTIKSISSALDAKDAYTHGHSMRVTLFSLIIAKALGLDDSQMEDVEIAGLLHDIGKIGIPENILQKPGKLTDDEFITIKNHPSMGEKMLNKIQKLQEVAYWINSHHERWDGRGYPKGLAQENIPLAARIIAVADTYDAMTSDRSYRKGLPHEVALAEIQKCAGSQFDPELVELFTKIEATIKSAEQNSEEFYAEYSILHRTYSVS